MANPAAPKCAIRSTKVPAKNLSASLTGSGGLFLINDMSHAAERYIDTGSPKKGLEIRARRFDRSFGQPQIVNLLTPEIHDRLRDIATLAEFPHGRDVIFNEGDEVSHIYFIASGMVRISRRAESGRRQVIAFMLSGDIFGFPEQGIYVNSARALGDVALYQVPWVRLNALMRDEPELQTSLLVRMAFDLRQAQKRILVLGQQNVSQRLASFLLDLMDHEDFYDAQQKQLLVPLSRFDLGDYLGTSPETVVRVLARLEKDGLIRRLSSRLLLIPSPEALVRLLRGRRRND
jgi:CRP/FNR family transcriptional regulator, anaerobic regulatory protein